ncbi:MAG: glycosyltransferase family 4 protein [Bdellovibrionota bacterium]
MKILHLIQRYPPAIGGSERWCAELARCQAKAGHEIEILTFALWSEEEYWHRFPPREGRPSLPPFSLDGPAENPIKVRRYRRTLLNPFSLRRSESTLLSGRKLDFFFNFLPSAPHSFSLYWNLPGRARWADIVHLHALPFPHNRAGALAARLFRKPFVVTPHFHVGDPAHEQGWALRLLSKSSAVFSVTKFEKEELAKRGVPTEKIHLTGNAIEASPYATRLPDKERNRVLTPLGIAPGTRLILCLGRKMPQKGLDTLLEAAPLVLKDLPQTLFILAGTDSSWFTERYRNLPAALKSKILSVGPVTEKQKIALLQASEVLVSPSEREAFGIVFLEAMACGLPIVATESGTSKEILGKAGVLFRPGNAGNLVRAVLEILEKPDRRKELTQAGQERLAQFPRQEEIAQTVEKVYRKILDHSRGGSTSDGESVRTTSAGEPTTTL